MASMGQDQFSDELVTLICSESNCSDPDEIIISTAEISDWDLPSILAHKVLKVKSSPTRLIEESSYFRGLLSWSFSESRLTFISIHWNLESFVGVLRVIFGHPMEISSYNFIPLNEAALFFGVDILISKCQVWLDEVTSFSGLREPQLSLDSLIQIWKYGLEHENDFIVHPCTSYLARNFMWASTCNSYTDVPEKQLCSCIEHPDLTVDSEKHLCDAILVWIAAKAENSKGCCSNDLVDKIRTSLLPLWFAAGKRSCRLFSKFADEATHAILRLARDPSPSLTDIFKDGNSSLLRIRLTKYTQKVDVSGCPQLTTGVLLLSMLPSFGGTDVISRKISKKLSNHANSGGNDSHISQALEQMLTFESVQELDISKCPSFSLESAIDCFGKLFPSLRSLRAAYFIYFKTENLCQLVQKLPLLSAIDLTMDVNPVIHAHVSITSSSSVPTPERSPYIYKYGLSKPLVSNIIKLTLEGRTNMCDSDLLTISEVCCSLSYVNIKGCTSATDHCISVMIQKCKKLQSIMACDTSFGNYSIQSLCSGNFCGIQHSRRHSRLLGYRLVDFHVGGCYEISGNMLSELIYRAAHHLRSLCLRESQVVNVALDEFSGSSLEILDVSDTEVRSAVLCHVINRNPGLKVLKIRGCRNLVQQESELCNLSSHNPQELYSVLGSSCKLEEIEVGWGFSFFSLGALKPAIRTLRTFVVGLGGSVGPDGLNMLPTICPMLEKLILYFQVISDSAITNIITNLPHLQVLSLCHCLGGISSLRFKLRMPNLRNLKLERVTRWMTNEDLATLAENCVNLVKLSLIGCPLLDSEAQHVISNGWPGLTYLHLEECGEITANGVTSLLNCHALEDLLTRHTGPGIPRNFIIYAASKLPMLRKISLDICDSKEGGFDIPSFADRHFLSIVKIARCKLQKSTLELHNLEVRRSPVHKETLVLVWNSEKLVQTVVKERL
ncbi:hypothetical protein CASFOL_009397 [Castilleja foliolosa]|uniref:BACK domain-containing protein n=1 Tax=Castilleja foliolosa TaxID=1961234 RepID=A0ABD3DX72_9LAMI